MATFKHIRSGHREDSPPHHEIDKLGTDLGIETDGFAVVAALTDAEWFMVLCGRREFSNFHERERDGDAVA